MIKNWQWIPLAILPGVMAGCLDDYLATEPPEILTDEQVWASPSLVTGVLAGYYARMPDYMELSNYMPFTQYDEALYSGIGNQGNLNYPYSTAAAWQSHYDLIRDINVAIDQITDASSPQLTQELKTGFIAELRFQRAWVHFDLVRRMGGVPIVDRQLLYDFGGDASYLQLPRNTEAEVYEFITSELDAIAGQLGNQGSTTRANRYTALALKSRAMLYAASLARHNNEMPAPITLPGGEVGIPADRADAYYQASLAASREIIDSQAYSLYANNADPGLNFYEALTVKNGNQEVIWAKDYSATGGLSHLWTLSVVPPSLQIDAAATNRGGAVSPSLQLVETFDFLDGSPGALPGVGDGSNTAAGQANWIFYDRPEDIFEGKDGRLFGTVIYPGTSARGGQITLQAGVYIWNSAANKYDRLEGLPGSQYADGGVLTGEDGPVTLQNYVTPTGFYVRKYLDSKISGATATTGSDVWWVRFRLGEIYLNAAEAAFELGLVDEALGYINRLRERAGFPSNSLTSLSREKIRSERWAELAFEDHRFWDVKRWRIAHEIWDGTDTSPTANLWSLWGYRIVRPGHPDDGKYVYDRIPSARQIYPRFWRLGNYYSEIPTSARGNNPKLVPNPFH